MLQPGRSVKLILGEPGISNFLYNAILFDAEQDSEEFIYEYGVFLVPQVSLSSPIYKYIYIFVIFQLMFGRNLYFS